MSAPRWRLPPDPCTPQPSSRSTTPTRSRWSGSGKAISYTTQAGHDAVRDFAFEDAATYFERALELVEQYEPSPASRRVELLTDLASALVYVDEKAGVETALRAVDTARRDGSLVQFGRAVAVAVEPVYGVIAFPAKVTSLFDEARAVLGNGDPALRARLLAFEAFKYATHTLHGRSGRILAEEAVALARDSDDPITLADALYALAVNLEGDADVTERIALGEELVSLGRNAGARASAFGLRVLAGAYLELGDADELTSTIEQLGRVGVEFRWLPAHVYTAQFRATQALLEGRFDDVRIYGDDLRGYARGVPRRVRDALHASRVSRAKSKVTLPTGTRPGGRPRTRRSISTPGRHSRSHNWTPATRPPRCERCTGWPPKASVSARRKVVGARRSQCSPRLPRPVARCCTRQPSTTSSVRTVGGCSPSCSAWPVSAPPTATSGC